MGVSAVIAAVTFNLVLVICTFPAYLLAKFSLLTDRCKSLHTKSCRRRAVLVSTGLAWRATLALCCWVRTKVDGLSEFRSTLGASGRAQIVVANHLSFLDTILLVSFTPVARLAEAKMLVSPHLAKMPFIGPLVLAMGHVQVPFKASGTEGGFEVDKELMAVRQREMEEHVAAGGIAGWFPEGTINKGDPREVGLFRAGGFLIPVHLDVEVWCAAFQGNGVCWPRTAAAGGRPARIGVKIVKLCDSSRAFFTSEGNVDPSDEQAAARFLANKAHDQVQDGVTLLNQEGFVDASVGRAIDGSREPLLQAERA